MNTIRSWTKLQTIIGLVGLLAIAVGLYFTWEYFHDLGLAISILLASGLVVALWLELPGSKWFYLDDVEGKLATVAEVKITMSTRDKKIGEVAAHPPVKECCDLRTRVHDTHDLVEEIQGALTKAVIIYVLCVIFSFIGIYQAAKPLEVTETQNSKASPSTQAASPSKLSAPYYYTLVMTIYLVWHASEARLTRKRNRLSLVHA